ncbi:MAG TPA: hypothetical protein VGE21_03465 [Flavobacteriales bacterium]
MSALLVRTFRVLPRLRTLLIGLCLSGGVQAQLLDSLSLFASKPPRLVVKLDTRGSFISNRNVGLWGAKVGLEHGGRLQYGIGYSFLRTEVVQQRVIEGLGMVPVSLRLGYVTPYVEYAFYQRGPWEVRIPVQFGIGAGSLVHRDAEGGRHRIQRGTLFVYEPSMTVQYRFLRYFGAGAGWGLRLVFTGADLGERLTAPIYVVGLKVFFGDLYRDLREG